jgi:hypothetical protein
VRIFKNTWFTKFAGKEGITDDELRELVNRLEAGQSRQQVGGADLGGGVYKMRLARPGEGKAGGYRVIVFFRSEERTFYEYCFAKSNRANISRKELKAFKKAAKKYLFMPPDQIRGQIEQGQLIEIQGDRL